jgi:hypothetical protein
MNKVNRKLLPFVAGGIVAIAIILVGVYLNWNQHTIPLVAGFCSIMVFAIFPR